jgi:hypothetical protein
MSGKLGLLVFAALAMAACADGGAGTVYPSGGGSAGAEGIGYCDSPPADVDDLAAWEEQCMPDRR